MTRNPRKRVFPVNPDPDHLRKEVKTRLACMKARLPGARLADMKFILAREYGFTNWAAFQADLFRRMAVRKIRLFRRAWTVVIATKNLIDQDADDAAFFRAGVAAQIGVIFAALVGVGMVCLTKAQMRTAHAFFGQLALLAHNIL